jgi:hypothetical protein
VIPHGGAEALEIIKVADVGLRVVEALSLIQSTAAAEKAVAAINQALSAKR